jgi:NADH dehydrogenase FAD-containing subunit
MQDVFVVGDAALVLDNEGKPLPTNAYFAEQHGRIAAQPIKWRRKKITGI